MENITLNAPYVSLYNFSKLTKMGNGACQPTHTHVANARSTHTSQQASQEYYYYQYPEMAGQRQPPVTQVYYPQLQMSVYRPSVPGVQEYPRPVASKQEAKTLVLHTSINKDTLEVIPDKGTGNFGIAFVFDATCACRVSVFFCCTEKLCAGGNKIGYDSSLRFDCSFVTTKDYPASEYFDFNAGKGQKFPAGLCEFDLNKYKKYVTSATGSYFPLVLRIVSSHSSPLGRDTAAGLGGAALLLPALLRLHLRGRQVRSQAC